MAESMSWTWWPLLRACATSLAALLVGLIGFAVVADSVQRKRRRMQGRGRSGIYSGRVWHVRFKPTVHQFSYPIFYCLIDLDELDITFPWYMWPVASVRFPALAQFRRSDHLKGDATCRRDGATGQRRNTSTSVTSHADRVRDIVEEASGTRPTGRVQLLTHLAYMGYCFNPVSFYYCLDESEDKIETVVGEVSNTPWGEMHCYVLNSTTQGVKVVSEDKQEVGSRTDSERSEERLVGVWFDKAFHVSPFMSMKHTYDWKFTPPKMGSGSGLTAQTTLLEAENGKIFFDAKVILKRHEFTAAKLCWCMTAYPIYTIWVQVLIHFEAFRLWWKQVPYFPHPEGTETFASRLVGAMMTPLFNAQEAWSSWQAKRKDENNKKDA
ncbi:unnamed protein product [Ascophyllum nodosum]